MIGEVVIQGDLSAQGDINIGDWLCLSILSCKGLIFAMATLVVNGARNMNRTIAESPDIFGPMQAKVQAAITTLLAVSMITKEYSSEGRLDNSVRSQVAQLSEECRSDIVYLENLAQEFEAWKTQDFRGDEVGEVAKALQDKILGFEEINNRIKY